MPHFNARFAREVLVIYFSGDLEIKNFTVIYLNYVSCNFEARDVQ